MRGVPSPQQRRERAEWSRKALPTGGEGGPRRQPEEPRLGRALPMPSELPGQHTAAGASSPSTPSASGRAGTTAHRPGGRPLHAAARGLSPRTKASAESKDVPLSVLGRPEPFWNKQLSVWPLGEGGSVMSVSEAIHLVRWSHGPKPSSPPSPSPCQLTTGFSVLFFKISLKSSSTEMVATTTSKEEAMEEKVPRGAAPTFRGQWRRKSGRDGQEVRGPSDKDATREPHTLQPTAHSASVLSAPRPPDTLVSHVPKAQPCPTPPRPTDT